MKKVVKVLMYVYRDNNGKKEFFVLHRGKRDVVVLTGHVGDHFINETLEQAAKREVLEELGVEPKNIINLNFSIPVEIKENNELSTEHAFLIEIPNKDVHFLEGDERHKWYSLEDLSGVLTYPNQKEPLSKIKQFFDKYDEFLKNSVSAIIIREKDNKVFIARRKENKEFSPGLWETIGGRIEKGETAEGALKREVKEELNVDIKSFKFFGNYEYRYYNKLFKTFIVELEKEPIPDGSDFEEWGWFFEEEIKKRDFAANCKERILDYFNKNKKDN